MKKPKNKPQSHLKKTTVTLTGTLSLPLCVGDHAWIRTSRQLFATSTVLKIMEVSEDGILFETCNTVYNLRYAAIPNESGVMCA